ARQPSERVSVVLQLAALHRNCWRAGRQPRGDEFRSDAERRGEPLEEAQDATECLIAETLQILAGTAAADDRDERLQHVVRALADGVDPGVPHPPLDRLIAEITLPAPHLER